MVSFKRTFFYTSHKIKKKIVTFFPFYVLKKANLRCEEILSVCLLVTLMKINK